MMASAGTRFLDLLERSVIVQGACTTAVVGVTLYLYATQKEVPSELLQLTWALLGIFIGGKIENSKSRLLSRR